MRAFAKILLVLLLAARLLVFAGSAWAIGASGSGGGAIASGTTPVTGGADKDVCFDDLGVMNCGSANLTFNKAGGLGVGVAAGATVGQIRLPNAGNLAILDSTSAARNVIQFDGSNNIQVGGAGVSSINLNDATNVGTGFNDATNLLTVGPGAAGSVKIDGFNNFITSVTNELDFFFQTNHSGIKLQSGGVVLRGNPGGAGTDDSAINSWSRMPYSFPIMAVAATTTTQWGEIQAVKSLIVENVTFNVGAFTCSVNPTLSLLDCSATRGTCTPVGTLATSGTLTGVGSTAPATTPVTTVAGGEYMAVEFTGGTCTQFNGSVQMIARPQ